MCGLCAGALPVDQVAAGEQHRAYLAAAATALALTPAVRQAAGAGTGKGLDGGDQGTGVQAVEGAGPLEGVKGGRSEGGQRPGVSPPIFSASVSVCHHFVSYDILSLFLCPPLCAPKPLYALQHAIKITFWCLPKGYCPHLTESECIVVSRLDGGGNALNGHLLSTQHLGQGVRKGVRHYVIHYPLYLVLVHSILQTGQ